MDSILKLAQAGTLNRPYPPSWFDRLKTWVERLPLPYWVTYALLGMVGLLLQSILRWQAGTAPFGTITASTIVFASGISFLLCAMHYLDRVALSALSAFRSALRTDEGQYAELEYKLSTLPARTAWLATVLVGIGAPLLFFLMSPPYASSFTGDLFAILVQILSAFVSWSLGGLGIYHTIHQLRQVSEIHERFAKIDLFQPGALYAFSSLTARTAIALPVVNLSWWVADPRYARDPLSLATGLSLFSLGLVTFMLPLWGVHQELAAQKAQRLDEVGVRFKALAAELHTRLDARELDQIERLNHSLSTLETEQRMIERIPTFPWHPDTVRTVITALLFPILLLIVQFAVQLLVKP